MSLNLGSLFSTPGPWTISGTTIQPSNTATTFVALLSASLTMGNPADVIISRPTTSSTTWTTSAATSGSPTGWVFDPGAHTGLTASVESSDVTFDLARSVQFATGALAAQRAVRFLAPAYAFVGASVLTHAATVYVSDAPTAGANATITNSYAWWVDAGVTRLDGGGAAFPGCALMVGAAAVTANRWIDIQQASQAGPSTAPVGLLYAGGMLTGCPAATEVVDVSFALIHTVEFATGAHPANRAFQIAAPTYAFVGASTMTAAATFYIDREPQPGANATLTSSYVAWYDAGVVRIDGGGTGHAGSALNVGPSAVTANRWIDVTQPVLGSGSPEILRLTGGAHTANTAGAEASDVVVNLARIVTFATGAIATQRAVRIEAPTFGFAAASTVTTAATFAISNQPAAGPNATITNSVALWVQAGNAALFGTPSMGAGTGALFVGNASVNPSTNPAGGGLLYSAAGAGTWRGSGGTVTAFGPAGPHCGVCGYDSWTVAAYNSGWKSWHFECAHCGAEYKGGPHNVLDRLDEVQKTERLEIGMDWDDVARVMGVAA